MFRSAILLALSVASASAAPAPADTAPYGLAWGQSRAEVEALGAALYDCRALPQGEICKARALPEPLSDPGVYHLGFDARAGLDSARFRSDPVTSDPTGARGKAMYERVRSLVSARHGPGRRQEFIFRAVPYMDADQFYPCLRLGGRCGLWTSEWRGAGIALALHALDPAEGDGGYVALTHFGPS